jgi:hypothetical protein
MAEQISLVKACMDFFTKEPYGRKVEVPEFKMLTWEDKNELRDMLIGQGYDVAELVVPAPRP